MTKANMPVIMRAGTLADLSDKGAYWTAVSAFRGMSVPGSNYQLLNAMQVTA